MLLYFLSKSINVIEINLRYFESFHDQSKEDSVHSAISSVMSKSGNIFITSHLYPIFKLARRKQLFTVSVYPMQFSDILDFKSPSEALNILSIRQDCETGEKINWFGIMEFKVSKEDSLKISFKTTHLQTTLSKYRVKTTKTGSKDVIVPKLNEMPLKISNEKYAEQNILFALIKLKSLIYDLHNL